jgi:hypothetical protein
MQIADLLMRTLQRIFSYFCHYETERLYQDFGAVGSGGRVGRVDEGGCLAGGPF